MKCPICQDQIQESRQTDPLTHHQHADDSPLNQLVMHVVSFLNSTLTAYVDMSSPVDITLITACVYPKPTNQLKMHRRQDMRFVLQIRPAFRRRVFYTIERELKLQFQGTQKVITRKLLQSYERTIDGCKQLSSLQIYTRMKESGLPARVKSPADKCYCNKPKINKPMNHLLLPNCIDERALCDIIDLACKQEQLHAQLWARDTSLILQFPDEETDRVVKLLLSQTLKKQVQGHLQNKQVALISPNCILRVKGSKEQMAWARSLVGLSRIAATLYESKADEFTVRCERTQSAVELFMQLLDQAPEWEGPALLVSFRN